MSKLTQYSMIPLWEQARMLLLLDLRMGKGGPNGLPISRLLMGVLECAGIGMPQTM